jgi:hypothetical protein
MRLPALKPSTERNAIRGRSRPLCAAIASLTIGAGLASRRYPALLPPFLAQYAGDTLWAAMVFWLLALVASRRSTVYLAVSTLVIAFAVEFSQLYHAAWADAVRGTWFGGLVIGSGFLWSDLACYTIGVGIAAGVDALFVRRA